MATAVRALGEVALRVNDLDRSQALYADVIGLELMSGSSTLPFSGSPTATLGTRPHWRSSTAKTPSRRSTARSTISRSPSRLRTTRSRSGGWRSLDSP
jgi:catechol-2,3-dioxygenase